MSANNSNTYKSTNLHVQYKPTSITVRVCICAHVHL